ncbi:superfamily II DNA or RNA helicase [Ochrobactrum sp. BH3]|nr:superfamily II DNA or RNA helicase [Ochrobactrum sp. BH3]
MTLRPYQADVIDSARKALERSSSVVIQMPTGAGKTKVATSMIADQEGPVWFICHRQEIERQAASSFAKAGIDFGVVSPRAEPDYSKPVQIVSHGTLARRINDLPRPSTVFWDECHHLAAKSWSAIREQLSDAKHIGLTATPERLDGKGLSNWFDELTVGPSTRELIDEGYLSEFRYFAPSDPDLSAARMQAGDYAKKDLAGVMNTPVLIGDAVREYNEKASGKRALIFAASVDMSKALVDRFNESGVPARHIDGTTNSDERDSAVNALASGAIKVLSNVEVFTEGFDLPAIDAVILMRPTKSLALFLQMIGRVLRKAEGKDMAIVIDHAGLWMDHGWFDAPIEWSLDGDARKRRLQSMGDGRLRRCPECKEVRAERAKVCKCGYEFPTGLEIGEFDGQLRELRVVVPEGCVTPAEFNRMAKEAVGAGNVHRWLINGLPNINKYPIKKEGLEWVASNVRVIEQGSESQHAFSKRVGVASGTITDWIRRGLPIDKHRAVVIQHGLDWVAINVRGLPPEGYEIMSDFARRIGIHPDKLKGPIRAGMPYDKIKGVPVEDATKWMSTYIPLRSKLRVPKGCISKTEFAKIHGKHLTSIYHWIQRGLPHVDGYPKVKEGAEWVRVNVAPPDCVVHETARAFANRLRKKDQGFVKDYRDRGMPSDKYGRPHIQRGLEWIRENTNMKIPPEAWPTANNNSLPTKQAA